jgi:lipoprotein-releasing system permease protein
LAEDIDRIYRISQSLVEGNHSALMGGDRVVIGRKMADDLGIKLGDRLEASFPRAKNLTLAVVGIFDTGTPLDESVVFVSLKTVQDFRKEGDVIN